jgi:hypothetical protein
MYEPNDPERNLLTTASWFQPFYRGVRKVRLDRARPTLHMLIQRRLRANEELRASVPQRDDADTHTFSDRSVK